MPSNNVFLVLSLLLAVSFAQHSQEAPSVSAFLNSQEAPSVSDYLSSEGAQSVSAFQSSEGAPSVSDHLSSEGAPSVSDYQSSEGAPSVSDYQGSSGAVPPPGPPGSEGSSGAAPPPSPPDNEGSSGAAPPPSPPDNEGAADGVTFCTNNVDLDQAFGLYRSVFEAQNTQSPHNGGSQFSCFTDFLNSLSRNAAENSQDGSAGLRCYCINLNDAFNRFYHQGQSENDGFPTFTRFEDLVSYLEYIENQAEPTEPVTADGGEYQHHPTPLHAEPTEPVTADGGEYQHHPTPLHRLRRRA